MTVQELIQMLDSLLPDTEIVTVSADGQNAEPTLTFDGDIACLL